MTRFEERGVHLQKDARTSFQAENRFKYSCNLCSTQGMRIECDRCSIKAAHDLCMDVLKNAETAPRFRIDISTGAIALVTA